MCAFRLTHPKESGEREQAPRLLHAPGPLVCDKGFAGAGIEAAEVGRTLVRPLARGALSPQCWPPRALRAVRCPGQQGPQQIAGTRNRDFGNPEKILRIDLFSGWC